jgi:hypothetical protein
MQVSKQKILEYNDDDLGLIATADAGTYPADVVLAVWEELAARGVVVEFMEQAMVPRRNAVGGVDDSLQAFANSGNANDM